MNKLFNEDEEKFVRENILGKGNIELANIFNKKYNRNITAKQMEDWKSKRKLKGDVHRIFTEKEEEFLKNNINGKSANELISLFNDKFRRNITKNQLTGYKRKTGLKSGIDGKFKKGHVSLTCKPVGYEHTTTDGMTFIKIGEPNVWERKQLYLYKKYKGVPPKGYDIIFADGDRTNFDLDNLIAVSKTSKLVMGKKGLFSKNGDVTKLGVLVANLILKNHELKKRGEL